MANLKKNAEEFFAKKLTEQQVNEICDELFLPEGGEFTDRQIVTAKSRINELKFRYLNAPDLQQFRGTAWGLLGAVSDMVTHAEPLRKTKNYQDRLMEGAIDGYDLINEAQALLAAA